MFCDCIESSQNLSIIKFDQMKKQHLGKFQKELVTNVLNLKYYFFIFKILTTNTFQIFINKFGL
jgi:hypothetical protein